MASARLDVKKTQSAQRMRSNCPCRSSTASLSSQRREAAARLDERRGVLDGEAAIPGGEGAVPPDDGLEALGTGQVAVGERDPVRLAGGGEEQAGQPGHTAP